MVALKFLFLNFWHSFKWVLRSKYKWFAIAFFVWLFRIEIMSGSGQSLQAVAFLFFAYKMFEYRNGIIWYTLNRTNPATKTTFLFYVYALVYSAWSFMPAFSVAILFQNLIILLACIWAFTMPRHFYQTERVFLLIGVSLILFETISLRVVWQPSIFTHHLASGTISAMMLSYCVAEFLNLPSKKNKIDKQRHSFLLGIIILCIIVLITSTSSGANASAVFGVGLGFFFSKKRGYGLLIILLALILFLNQDIIEDLILFLMPGKNMDSVASSSGRQVLWDYEKDFFMQKPLFGWGFACIERVVTANTDFPAMDAHNSYLGILGGLGIVGFLFFLLMIVQILIYTFKYFKYQGYHGIFCSICCALLNGYSFGFLSGKTCVIIVFFFMFVALTAGYRIAHRYDRVFSDLNSK